MNNMTLIATSWGAQTHFILKGIVMNKFVFFLCLFSEQELLPQSVLEFGFYADVKGIQFVILRTFHVKF